LESGLVRPRVFVGMFRLGVAVVVFGAALAAAESGFPGVRALVAAASCDLVGQGLPAEQRAVGALQERTHVRGVLGNRFGLADLGVHHIDRKVGVMLERVRAHALGAGLPPLPAALGRFLGVGVVVAQRPWVGTSLGAGPAHRLRRSLWAAVLAVG